MARIGLMSGVVLAAASLAACRTSDSCRPEACVAPIAEIAPDRPPPPPPRVPPVVAAEPAPAAPSPVTATPPAAAKEPSPAFPTDAPAVPILTLAFPESGLLTLDGSPLGRLTGAVPEEDERTLGKLRSRLHRASAEPGGRDADGTSRVQLVIVAPRAAKWKFVQWIMQVCDDPEVRIQKLHFVVVPYAPAAPSASAPGGR